MQPEGLSIIKMRPDVRNIGTQEMFFENLPELLRPELAAEVLGLSRQTIYDWRYRQKQRGIPPTLFIKINRFLYLRTKVLRNWIALQNSASL